jgi:transposase-like zinc-binding protein
MSRPPLEVADLIRAAGEAFIARNCQWLRWKHVKVLRAIARCRTAALGGHLDECTRCGHRAISFNSCRDRHCPKCQIAARERWIAARQRELLPTRYAHVVFTLPRRLATISCSAPVRKLFWKWPATLDAWALKLDSSVCCIPGVKSSNFTRMSIVSFPPAVFRPITPAGFAHQTTTFFPRRCCAKSFAANSSMRSNRLFRMVSSTSTET